MEKPIHEVLDKYRTEKMTVDYIVEKNWGDKILVITRNSFVTLSWEDDAKKHAFISGLYVAEKNRQKGIATILMTTMENMAKELGSSDVSLFADKNTIWYEWYKRRGYKDNTRTSQVGYVEYIEMTKTLIK